MEAQSGSGWVLLWLGCWVLPPPYNSLYYIGVYFGPHISYSNDIFQHLHAEWGRYLTYRVLPVRFPMLPRRGSAVHADRRMASSATKGIRVYRGYRVYRG